MYVYNLSMTPYLQVSRQGEWLVIQEKVGLLTTQNGTQQIHEKRIRINEQDLINYCEDGV